MKWFLLTLPLYPPLHGQLMSHRKRTFKFCRRIPQVWRRKTVFQGCADPKYWEPLLY